VRCSSRWYGKPIQGSNTGTTDGADIHPFCVWTWRHRRKIFTSQAIGFVDCPYKDAAAIPKGSKHDAEDRSIARRDGSDCDAVLNPRVRPKLAETKLQTVH
jgi:hypothetical protein